MGFNPKMGIHRRDLRAVELDNPHIAKIGIGGVHDPEISCFDDHAIPARERCSLSLMLQALGILEHANQTWPWLAATEILDTRGLGAVNRAYNIPKGQLDGGGTWLAVASPLDKYVLDVWGRYSQIKAGHEIHTLMRDIGYELVSELSQSARHFEMLDRHTVTILVGEPETFRVLWIELPGSSRPDRWLAGYCARQTYYPDIVVLPARFGPGYFVQFKSRFRVGPRELADAVGGDYSLAGNGVRFTKITQDELQNKLSMLLSVDDTKGNC